MEEERRKVLQMLAEGQITPAQANEFLEVLSTQQDGGEAQSPQQSPEVASQGPFGKLTIDQAVQAKMFGLEASFMREMTEAGFPGLSFDQLIEGRCMVWTRGSCGRCRERNCLTLPSTKSFKPKYLASMHSSCERCKPRAWGTCPSTSLSR